MTGLARRWFLAAPLLVLGGCAVLGAPGADLSALPPAPLGAYRLGAGDAVDVRIYDQPQLSGTYPIDDGGNIDVSLLGLVAAGGLTTAQLGNAIGAALRAKNLILAPSVAVAIATYRPFYILGEVNNQGQYPYRPGMTVLTAVSIAGGFTYRAVEGYVGVTRDVGGQAAKYRAENFREVSPGDVITVFERRF